MQQTVGPTVAQSGNIPEDADAVVVLRPGDPRDPWSPATAGDVVAFGGRPAEFAVGAAEDPVGTFQAVAAGVRSARRHAHVAVEIPQDGVLPAITGACAAAYRFSRPGDGAAHLAKLTLVTPESDAAREALEVAAAVGWARWLVDLPPADKTPQLLAALMLAAAAEAGVDAEAWDEERLAAERCGGVLGVAQGSTEPPRLVRLAHRPPRARAHVALVGKGVCFDSGGLVIKDGRQMLGMKGDMAGAAVAAAVVLVAARLELDVAVSAWLPLVENMPGGAAIKVEDVVRTRSGRTIEVIDTDAEGRLILADGLCLAAEETPDAIIDLATLTGSVIAALGRDVSAYFANDDALAGRLEAAASAAGEPQWRLPLVAGYRAQLRSEIADVRNCPPNGGIVADGVLAALLLEDCVASLPWAHIDFAGPAYRDSDGPFQTPGGTGFGISTLVRLLRDWPEVRR